MEAATTEMREVTLDEAIAIAVFLQKNGQLADAEDVYRKVLGVVPDHPAALHFSGVLAHQQGRSGDAIALIERSLELEPGQADCYSNLGIVRKARGEVDEAIVAYRHALELDPDHANAHNNLGVLLKARGATAEAEQEYRTAIGLNPEYVEAYHNLGILLAATKRIEEAVVCYCRVLTLDPAHAESRKLLALAHCTLGEHEKAIDIFARWIAEDPGNPVARHMLAAVSGDGVPARADDAYVEQVFDDFAASFDAKLARLSYRAPHLVAAVLADSGAAADGTLDVLDAGCGTGLCGPLIAAYARRLTGVDLSAGMLAQAQEKGVYHELVKRELTGYLREHTAAFDLIVSADTLVYFGVLEEVASAAANALRPDGSLIFSVEEAAAAEAPAGFCIRFHGRYAHTRDYVERALAAAGLRPEIVRAELRLEAGAPVAGLVVRAAPARGR